MLGDDVMDGTKRGVEIVAHAAKNVVKGALLFAAVVGGACAIAAIGAAVLAPGIGIAGLFGVVAEAFTGSLATTAAGGAALSGAQAATMAAGANLATSMINAGGYALTAGVVGGGVTGVASLLPGKDDIGNGMRKLFRRSERSEASRQQVVYQQAPAPRQETVIVEQPAPAAKPHVIYRQAAPQPPETVVVDVPAPQQRNVVYRQAAPQTQTILDTAPAQQGTASTSVSVQFPQENPYYKPGHGTEMMQRGNDRSNEAGLQK